MSLRERSDEPEGGDRSRQEGFDIEVFGIKRSSSRRTKQEHVDHLIDEHGIPPPEGAHNHRLRLLHGAASFDLRIAHKSDQSSTK